MGEAAYILGIKIYRDRSRRLLAFSQITYLDKVLNGKFQEGNFASCERNIVECESKPDEV
jgi:hypothetical protein